jgi:hypothetical protein
MVPHSSSGRGEYKIVVKGHLDEQWSDWFEGLAITTGFGKDGTPITTFTGSVADQAALHGVLARIRDINMPLISVTPIKSNSKDEADPQCLEQAKSEGGADACPEQSRRAD